MKSGFTILLVVLGAVALSCVINYPQMFASRTVEARSCWSGQTVEVNRTQMLYFQHRAGWGVVEFTNYLPNEAGYRFRFRSAESGAETNGAGSVFINLEERESRPNWRSWRNDPYVKVGGLQFAWTNGGPDSSLLFFHSNRTHVAILPGSEFDTFDFRDMGLGKLPERSPTPRVVYVNAALGGVSVMLGFTVLIILFIRFRLGFLVLFLASGVLGFAWVTLFCWRHFFPADSPSTVATVLPSALYTASHFIDVAALIGCLVYLRRVAKKGPDDDASTVP